MTTESEFETFFQQFIATALWCSSDINSDSDISLQDQNYSINNIDSKSLESLKTDCRRFFDDNYSKIKDDLCKAGHDFWLTSNHHGAGFWDGDWEKEIGQELTEESHKYSEHTFYVNNGVVYCD